MLIHILLLARALSLAKDTTAFWKTVLASSVDFEAEAGYCDVRGSNSGKVHYQLFSMRGRKIGQPQAEDPVVLWLGGGPGMSSYAPAFTEFGPVSITNSSGTTKVELNYNSWNEFAYLLFLDPLNVGFSYDSGNRTRPDQPSNSSFKMAQDLLTALRSFYGEHKALAGQPLYIGGVGYGGKVAVALSQSIARNQPSFKLKGLVLNGAEVNPIVQNNHFDGMFYSAGVVDRSYRDSLAWYQTKYISSVMQGNYSNAYSCYHFLVENSTNLEKFVAGVRIDNYRFIDKHWDNAWAGFLEKNKAEMAVVNETQFIEWNRAVHSAFVQDMSLSYSEELKFLLNKGFRVLSLNGANDLSVGPASAQLLVNSINWDHSRDYRQAEKRIVRQFRSVIGWEKSAKNLWVAVVYDAGKHVARDQPLAAFVMMERFIAPEAL